ncbi:hypothetical protein HF257_05625 [Pseudomonas sp. WS 5106]|uniref:DUF4376 domain-containing protein n=1 Tax=Pseudomonas cremoris TaxID=2724178 RepID=A0A7X1DXI7_9PSED|nr:hypothetical protein [Pseudomonas cremoris]MBC2405474.1 hypothetical protein [Pseudomonas cremoris]
MWARIDNGLVVELTDKDPAGRFHPSYEWAACNAEVAQGWLWDGKAFEPSAASSMGAAHAAKVAEINLGCERAITGGFWSDALGGHYQYSSQLDDQMNLTSAILGAMDILYPCNDELGVKAFRSHTAEQLRQVGIDFTAFKLQLLQKADRLKRVLDQALADRDPAALESITWEASQP